MSLTPPDISSTAQAACAEAVQRIADCGRRRVTVLDLSRLGLTRLPPQILQLTKLTELDLSHNSLATLPPAICQLDKLTRLNLSSNPLATLPPELGQLTRLTVLDLSHNALAALPPELGQLTQLTRLDLSSNNLTALPPGLGRLARLTRLYLTHNRLAGLPPEIGRLTSLTRLYLAHNMLDLLPPEFGGLASLTRLDLSNNKLRNLPPEFGRLARLTVCDLSNNMVAGLPPEFGGLAKLTVLSLLANELAGLPDELRDLEHLESLLLHDNPALQLAPSVLGADPRATTPGALPAPRPASARAILDFYFARKTGRTRPLNEVKLVMLGRRGAGKTGIVQALRDLPFHERAESTPGIALCDWTLEGGGGLPVTVHVWDCSGQEITHALHPLFFSPRNVYVVVLTGRDDRDPQDASYWLRLIQTCGTAGHGQEPPVIVALNQWNVPGARAEVDRAALRERYPFIRGFVEMDCKTKKGIPVLKAALFRELERMPWVREPIPEGWDAVRLALTTAKPWTYLTEEQYRVLCAGHGVTDAGQQDYLTEILHHQGSALNYRHDPRLHEADTLQPEWFTRHLYALLQRAVRQAGVLTQADVDALLYADQDESARACLMRILGQFGIVCPLQAAAGAGWLVPRALPDTPPAGLEAFRDAAEASELGFTYQNEPDGLVERVIARRYDFIEEVREQKQLWRNGLILARKGARALIRMEPQHRQITISVSGPRNPRQQLAGLCQAEMREIHAEMPGLGTITETQAGF